MSDNTAGASGGGVLAAGTLTIQNESFISSNTALDGAGIAITGVLAIDGGEITANSAGSLGGGIYNSGGSVAITGATLAANIAMVDGGGIYVKSGTVTISAFTLVEDNSAGIAGGGIDNAGALLVLSNDFVYGNTANDGGGIDNAGTMAISIVTFAGNSAVNSGVGGGIYNSGTGTVTDVTLGSDQANSHWRAIPRPTAAPSDNLGTLTISNTTIAENTAVAGGGIWNFSTGVPLPGVLTTINVTIADNTVGGGLLCELRERSTLYNTIVAANTITFMGAADDVATAAGIELSAGSHNDLIGVGGCGRTDRWDKRQPGRRRSRARPQRTGRQRRPNRHDRACDRQPGDRRRCQFDRGSHRTHHRRARRRFEVRPGSMPGPVSTSERTKPARRIW